MTIIIQATLGDLGAIAPLFDRYRVFYQQPSDLAAARSFIEQRLTQADSVIFLAKAERRDRSEQRDDSTAMGFTQLYPSFSSVSLRPIWVLNDLYVEAAYRQQGVAMALMAAAENYARQSGAVRVTLSTQVENHAAQALYTSRGYQRDQAFHHYALEL